MTSLTKIKTWKTPRHKMIMWHLFGSYHKHMTLVYCHKIVDLATWQLTCREKKCHKMSFSLLKPTYLMGLNLFWVVLAGSLFSVTAHINFEPTTQPIQFFLSSKCSPLFQRILFPAHKIQPTQFNPHNSAHIQYFITCNCVHIIFQHIPNQIQIQYHYIHPPIHYTSDKSQVSNFNLLEHKCSSKTAAATAQHPRQ